MADRYQNRPAPSDYDYDRDAGAAGRAEADPLAELARLIGQTDPYASLPGNELSPAPHPLQSRANVRPRGSEASVDAAERAAGPPPWMQRVRQEAAPLHVPEDQEYEPEADYQPAPLHPVHRYRTERLRPQLAPEYHEPARFSEPEEEPDPSRYDDALYGRIENGDEDFRRSPAYPDDPYADHQNAYEEEEPQPRKRRGGLAMVFGVLALAVVGTGAAFGYKTFIGSPRSGEPPIIKADNSPTKVMPAPSDTAAKTPDRLAAGDGGEKLVSREETPVDVNSKSGPRVVFPPLNQNSNPPSVASVSPPATLPATAPTGTLPNNEPRKIRTLSVKSDAADAGLPAAVPPPPAKQPTTTRSLAPAPRGNPSAANASANGPMALTPEQQPDPAPTRMASTTPTGSTAGAGGYLVQVSSQKNEAEAQASFRALQGKYPSVLGSRSAIIKRADLGEKGVYYRANVGPFSTPDHATQFCGSLKSAGGNCVVQRN